MCIVVSNCVLCCSLEHEKILWYVGISVRSRLLGYKELFNSSGAGVRLLLWLGITGCEVTVSRCSSEQKG